MLKSVGSRLNGVGNILQSTMGRNCSPKQGEGLSLTIHVSTNIQQLKPSIQITDKSRRHTPVKCSKAIWLWPRYQGRLRLLIIQSRPCRRKRSTRSSFDSKPPENASASSRCEGAHPGSTPMVLLIRSMYRTGRSDVRGTRACRRGVDSSSIKVGG